MRLTHGLPSLLSGCLLLAVASSSLLGCSGGDSASARRSIVRVVTPSGHGTGFFVRAPSGEVLVATAFHVVSDGAPVTIERQIDVSDKDAYHVAYPETELAAYDADADLALIRVKNVPADTFKPLALGKPRKDSAITSWGFPGSALVDSLDLTRKEGKLSNLVRLGVEDPRTGEVLKENAVPGLIVSTALEPGFSGGPTLDSDLRVVGVNVMKDREHNAQNACVDAGELDKLLAAQAPIHTPTADEVREQLLDLQKNFLQVAASDRERVREADVIDIGELPRLRALGSVILEADRSDQAGIVGIALSRMPGRLLPEFTSARVRDAVAECRKRADSLQQFLESIGSGTASGAERCDDHSTRALIADLMGATLRWDGKERDISVNRIEEVDADRHLYRANVTFGGGASASIGLGWSSGRLRVRLFDQQGRLAALQGGAPTPMSSVGGDWAVSDRLPLPGGEEYARTESLRVGVLDASHVTVVHQYTGVRRTTKPGWVFKCNDRAEIRTRVTQEFVGQIEGSDLVLVPAKPAEFQTPRGCESERRYTADTKVRLKVIDGQLVMLRTDGKQWPEAREFQRPPSS
jgi:hypothetical protein